MQAAFRVLEEADLISIQALFPNRAAAMMVVRLDPGVGDLGPGWGTVARRAARLKWWWHHGLAKDWRVVVSRQCVGWGWGVDREGRRVVVVGDLEDGQVLGEVERVEGGGDGGQVVEVVDERGVAELVYLEADEVEVVGEEAREEGAEVVEEVVVVDEEEIDGAWGGEPEPDGAVGGVVGMVGEDEWAEAMFEIAVEEVVWRRRRA